MFSNKFRQLRQWFSNRKQVARMEHYPEYLLRDIGLEVCNGKLQRRPQDLVLGDEELDAADSGVASETERVTPAPTQSLSCASAQRLASQKPEVDTASDFS